MKIKSSLSGLGCLLLLAACSDQKQLQQALLFDCISHYRAESYLVASVNCELAAKQDIIKAQWVMAKINHFDLAEKNTDLAEAFHWYLKAAQAGMSNAQWQTGVFYSEGKGVAKNLQQAEFWLTQSAKQGSSGAAYALASFYRKEKPNNLAIAINWYTKAANKGHLTSINNLAWLLSTSANSEFLDVKKAQFWAKRLPTEQQALALHLDTFAAVSARAGEFSKAVEYQNLAIAKLPEDVEEQRLLKFQQRLESYQNNLPWQETL